MASPAQINPDLLSSHTGLPSAPAPLTFEAKLDVCKKRASPGFLLSIALTANESREVFIDLLYDLIAQYDPATLTEQILLEKMLQNQWFSLRAARLQSVLLNKTIHLDLVPDGFGVMLRSQTAADRAFHKALSELLKLQKERKKAAIGFESQKAQTPNPKPAEPQAEPPQNPPESAPPEPPSTPEIAVPVVATIPTLVISLESANETVAAVREMPPNRKKAA